VQVNFAGVQTIDRIDVVTIPDDTTAEPVPTMTFTKYGITSYDVQYWTGTTWATVPGGSVTGNNLVWRTFTFTPISTDRIRVLVKGATSYGYSFIAEVEAWGTSQGGGGNTAPTVAMTSPSAGVTFTAPATIVLGATSGDNDGSVAKVEFFSGATKVGEDLSAPYTVTLSNVAAGTYTFTAVATDNLGATATSGGGDGDGRHPGRRGHVHQRRAAV